VEALSTPHQLIGRKEAVGRLQRHPGRLVIKRLLQLALACVLLLALPVLSGCQDSGDVQGASRLIESANARYQAFSTEFADLADYVEKFFASYSHAVKPTAEQAEASMQDFRAKLDALMVKVNETRHLYNKVVAIKDVEHYRAYADLRLDMLDQLAKTTDVIARTFPLVEKAITDGKLPDVNALKGAKRELIGIEMEVSFKEAQADELASDTHLKVKIPPSP